MTAARLGSLRTLDVRSAEVSREVVRALANAPALGALEELDISDNSLGPEAVGDDDVEILLCSETLRSLRRIVLLPPRIWGSAGEVDVAQCRERLGLR